MSRLTKAQDHEAGKRYRENVKRKCFEHYCAGEAHCIECGERELSCLELHHPEGGGNRDRAEKIGNGLRSCGGRHFYLKLKQLGYPEGYVVICTKCHDKKHGRTPLKFRNYGSAPGSDPLHYDDVVPF